MHISIPNKKTGNKHLLIGAVKISLLFLTLIVAIFTFSFFFTQNAQAAFGAIFVVNNISSSPIFAGSNAGVNTTFLESGATNVTLNISLRVANGQGANFARNMVGVNITLPPGFTFFPGDFSNETSNVSANNKTGNVFFNETFGGGYTNLTWRNQTGVAVSLINGTNSFAGQPGQFAFRINVPAYIAKENRGNRTFNITVTTVQLILTAGDSSGATNHTNTANITIFINDTIAPNAVRYISPTPANATTLTNSTVDFMVAFNETNPDFVNLSVGFPNGTFQNRSMTISGGGSTGQATASILGLPAGANNFTVFATDVDNNQVQNSTFYTLTISSDSTAPGNFTFISPTIANNTNTTNTTLDIAFNYTEANPDTAFLQIGFPNGSAVNRTNTTQIVANTATYAVRGLPDGIHNFTMFANDTNSNQGTNTSLYRIFIDTTAPSATLTLPSVFVQKGKPISSSTMTCSATDATSGFSSTSFSLRIDKPSGQTVTHTCGNEYTDTFDIGEYKATFSPQDRAGNTGSKSGTFTVKYSETASVGSTASPSQSTSSAAEDLAKTIFSIGEALTSAKPVELTIPQEIARKSVSKITLEVSEDVPAEAAKVEVKALEKIPESDSSGQQIQPLPADQPVLKTMEFIVPESLTSKLKQATIEFSLGDIELSANSMGINDVVMERFNSGIWNELPTSFIETENSTNKFSATTPGFSVFIVTKKSQIAETGLPQATREPAGPRVSEFNKTSEQTPGLTSLQNLVYLGIVLIIAVAVVFSVKRNYISKIIKRK